MSTLRSRAACATLVAATCLAPSAVSQTGAFCLDTINPFASNNGGGIGGAVYFDVTVQSAVVVTDLIMNYGSTAGSTVGVQMYVAPTTSLGNESNPGAWTLVSQGTGTAAGNNNRTICTLDVPYPLAPGSYGVALVGVNANHRYTNGTGSNQRFSDSFLRIDLGTASNRPFAAPTISPRIWNGAICYVPAQGYALAARFGSGCGAGTAASFYELFDGSNAADLSNSAGLTATWNGSSYVLTGGARPLVTPTSPNLGLGVDAIATIPLPWSFPTQIGAISTVYLCSNGWLSFVATGFSDPTESVADFLANETRIAMWWDDLDPSAGGSVHAEADPTDPTRFHITFDRVPERGGANPNTFQLTLSRSGDFELKYGTVNSLDGLVGYSLGGGAVDPGTIDISALRGPVALGDDRPALELSPVNRPAFGRAAVTETRNIPGTAMAGFHLYGAIQIPGALDLTAFGAPGCLLHVTGAGAVGFGTSTATALHSIHVPTSSALVGARVYCQSVVVDPTQNQLNVVTSNGVDWTLDQN